MLKFRIMSSRTVEGVENEKKFVAYTLRARQDCDESKVYDRDPADVERRYTQFLDLYNGLKKDFPALMSSISFPRKIVMGNFDPNIISTRCAAFQSMLNLIASESRLRDCPAAIAFFQDAELIEARWLISEGKFDQALSMLETSFKFLNKVYTDRSRVVLCALCRIVACAGASGGALAGPVERWAQLALRRYEAVSDSDLLLIYIPLLHTCISIWETLGRDKSKLVEELNDLRKRGALVVFGLPLTLLVPGFCLWDVIPKIQIYRFHVIKQRLTWPQLNTITIALLILLFCFYIVIRKQKQGDRVKTTLTVGQATDATVAVKRGRQAALQARNGIRKRVTPNKQLPPAIEPSSSNV